MESLPKQSAAVMRNVPKYALKGIAEGETAEKMISGSC